MKGSMHKEVYKNDTGCFMATTALAQPGRIDYQRSNAILAPAKTIQPSTVNAGTVLKAPLDRAETEVGVLMLMLVLEI
jgi:hypothetical protein